MSVNELLLMTVMFMVSKCMISNIHKSLRWVCLLNTYKKNYIFLYVLYVIMQEILWTWDWFKNNIIWHITFTYPYWIWQCMIVNSRELTFFFFFLCNCDNSGCRETKGHVDVFYFMDHGGHTCWCDYQTVAAIMQDLANIWVIVSCYAERKEERGGENCLLE